ncbi:MAG: hypothetical protein IH886_03905 [Nitrospinae bacterium]|nr:hypothetical protein [Nitrospinota bacterium]
MKSVTASCIVCACLGLFASEAFAQLFGGDNNKWERILLEIKKLNTRIVEKVIPQIDRINSDIKKIKIEISRVKTEVRNVRSGNNNLSEQIETLSNMIPGIQSSMEQSQVRTMQQIQALGKRLEQLEAKIKAEQAQQARNQQVQLDAIKQEVATQLGSLKDGMAKDMEQIAKLNQSAFQELIKSNEKHLRNQNARVDKSIAIMTEMAKGGANTSEALAVLQAGLVENSKARSEQNKKIIDILSKSLKEQQAAAIEIDALGGNQAKSDENVRYARETMVALKGILDKRLAEIDKTQQALQAQNDQAMQDADLIKQNLQITDQKINKLAEGLQAIHNQGIDTTKSMLTNASEVNQKIDENRAEVKLTSEKITKLIEILKAIAEKQGKLEQLLASQGGKGGNKQLMNALADLKRKANVNISRNDRILKKLKGSR